MKYLANFSGINYKIKQKLEKKNDDMQKIMAWVQDTPRGRCIPMLFSIVTFIVYY